VEEALVCGGDVGVGAEDGGDAAVEVPAEGGFFAGGFGVEVEEDDFGVGVALDHDEELVGFTEGVVGGGHEDAALHVHDGVLGAVAELTLVESEAGCAVREVGGAEDAAAASVGVGGDRHVFDDLFFVPDVVAGGDDVGAEVEEFFGDGGCDAEAAGGVFAVDDKEIDGVSFEDVGEVLAYDVAAGRSEDVADEENVHLWILARAERKSFDAKGAKKGATFRERKTGKKT